MQSVSFHVVYPEEGTLQWKNCYQIAYVLKGSISMLIGGREQRLQCEDFIVINPFSPYLISRVKEATLLYMEMPYELIRQASDYPLTRQIECCSANGKTQEYDQIRQVFANLFELFSVENEQSHLRAQSRALVLFDMLFSDFATEKEGSFCEKDEKMMWYLQEVIRYVQENFREEIHLETIGRTLQVSSHYLARGLRKYLGQSFRQIVQQFRMQQAIQMLENSEESVAKIAYDAGFSSSSSFITKFREQYGETPLTYRKRKRKQMRNIEQKLDTGESIFQNITRYTDASVEKTMEHVAIQPMKTVICDMTRVGKPVDHYWQKVACIGWAVEGLSAVIQRQICMAQKDIGFEYLRFHGIFDDDMLLYREDESGKPELNFTYCDMLMDFLQSVGMKPYLELGYIPGALCDNLSRSDMYHAHICMPNSWDKWDYLVEQFVRHYIDRYGMRVVREWRFTPMMCNHILYDFFTWDEYNEMYEHVWNTIKSIDAEIPVGGPGIDISIILYQWEEVFEPYLRFAQEKGCIPDFITLKVYPYNMCASNKKEWDLLTQENADDILWKAMDADESSITHMMHQASMLLKHIGFQQEQIAVEAWNASYSQSDVCNDLCYKSAFLVKNILENQNQAWCMAYWTISDYMVDIVSPREQKCFHGGTGLLTSDGLKKAGYQALCMLSTLKGRRLKEGDGFVITKDNDGICIMVWQYCHYNLFHRAELEQSSTVQDPYLLCQIGERQVRRFELKNLEDGEYSVETHSIGRNLGGSSYDVWAKMGQPNRLNYNQRRYIENNSMPLYRISSEKVKNGELTISCRVDPHDVILIQVTKKH